MVEEAVKSPTRATKLRRLSGLAEEMDAVPSRSISLPKKIPPSQALGHILENNHTKDAYVNMRLMSKEFNADIWPTYDAVLEAKKECRPDNISYSETAVTVPLSERLKHNDRRFLSIHQPEITSLLRDIPPNGKLEIEVESKVGFDGSTGLQVYNQAFSLENKDTNESSLLSTCLVPLQYRVKDGPAILTNPVPQSSSFCQPLRQEFRKETPEVSKEIDAWIDEGINAIKTSPHIIDIPNEDQPGSKQIVFIHVVRKTMYDTKAKNAVTDTAAAVTCFLCGANPTDFNDLSNFPEKFPTNEANLQYGAVCDLHAWLRSFDAINSLSDKLTVKKWRIAKTPGKKRKNETKEQEEERIRQINETAAIVEARKKERQTKFKEKMNLLVDVPRQGGAGNSNSGNVARRAFQDEETFAEITEVDVRLIRRLHVMLIAINKDFEIDCEAFREYGLETAALWIFLYPWHPMTVSIHHLCIHGWESMKFSSLPISFYTEQSLESTNKSLKYDRTHHSRKDSRLHCITDQFNRQNDKSDIVIALYLQQRRRRAARQEVPVEVFTLLKKVSGGSEFANEVAGESEDTSEAEAADEAEVAGESEDTGEAQVTASSEVAAE